MPEYPLDDPLLMALREARPLLDDEFDPRQPEAVALRHEIVHNRSPRLTGSVLRPGGSARNRPLSGSCNRGPDVRDDGASNWSGRQRSGGDRTGYSAHERPDEGATRLRPVHALPRTPGLSGPNVDGWLSSRLHPEALAQLQFCNDRVPRLGSGCGDVPGQAAEHTAANRRDAALCAVHAQARGAEVSRPVERRLRPSERRRSDFCTVRCRKSGVLGSSRRMTRDLSQHLRIRKWTPRWPLTIWGAQ